MVPIGIRICYKHRLKPKRQSALVNKCRDSGLHVVKVENPDIKDRWVALEYVFSKCLIDIERGISQTVQGVALSKKAVCIALARIKREGLHEQVGIETFKAYLKSRRIDLPYSTAIEYSQIGEVYLKYRAQLEEIKFTEESGLKKLLFLEEGLRANGDKKDVLDRVRLDSLREFKSFVRGRRQAQNARAFSGESVSGVDRTRFSLKADEESVWLSPINVELVWFNPQLGDVLHSPEVVRKFRDFLVDKVKLFLLDQGLIEGNMPDTPAESERRVVPRVVVRTDLAGRRKTSKNV
jgi:hypothetical protein